MPPQLNDKATIQVEKQKYAYSLHRTFQPLASLKKGQDDQQQESQTPAEHEVHVLQRSSSHLRKNQMKIVDSRTVIFDEPEIQQQREKVVVEIQLELDQLHGKKPGLVLERTRGTSLLLVHTIRDEGWFPKTNLQVGMAILAINGVPMAGRTPSKVIKALSMAQDAGWLSLVAGHYALPSERKRTSSKSLPQIKEEQPDISQNESIELILNEGGTHRPSEMPRYSRLHTIVTKRTKHDLFGITFRKNGKDAPLVIQSLAKGGKFQGSQLSPGMVVMQVNEKDATWMSPKEAVEELQTAQPGEITITTEGYTGKAFKAYADDSLGLFVTNSSARKGVFIVGIDPTSEFAKSELRVGMQVLLINGKPCPLKAEEADNLLEEAQGKVTILATLAFLDGDNFTVSDMTSDNSAEDGVKNGETMESTAEKLPKEEEVMVLRKLPTRRRRSQEVLLSSPTASCFGGPLPTTKSPKKQRSELVHISMHRELRRSKPGIVLAMKKDRGLVVKQIRENSWFKNTALEPGMVLLAIDNQSIVQKDVEQIFMLFQEARKSGRMLLTARKGENGLHEEQRLSRIQAIAYKKSPNVPIGVTFSRADSTSPLVIKHIADKGIMSDTMLQPGMVVLQINGRRASWLSPAQASAAIEHAPAGRISITAEGFSATAHKSRRNEGYGLIVKNSSSREGLFISHIKENSPFALSSLKPGMQILLINGKPCPSTLKATGKLLRKCGEKVNILATSAFQEGYKITLDDLATRQEGPFLDNYFQCFVFDFV